MSQTLTICAQVTPDEDHKTFYSPGDLYDLLSTSSETRFHASYLFMRYFIHVAVPEVSQSKDEDLDFEAIIWDLAVACLALSVKVCIARPPCAQCRTCAYPLTQFHRDVLFPLEIIFAEEFIGLAPHEMEFDDLESAQRDVLDAVGYRVGSATPGAFMDELWRALPTMRLLLGFDDGWEDVQRGAWAVLCDVLRSRFFLLCLLLPGLTNGVVHRKRAAAVSDLAPYGSGADGKYHRSLVYQVQERRRRWAREGDWWARCSFSQEDSGKMLTERAAGYPRRFGDNRGASSSAGCRRIFTHRPFRRSWLHVRRG